MNDITVTFNEHDQLAMAVVLEVAAGHPAELQEHGEAAGVKPEWLMGLIMTLEKAGF